MTLSRAFRFLLSLASILIVGWSFFDVGRRMVAARQADRNRPITLTVLHWGDQVEDRIVDSLVNGFMKENSSVRVVRINGGGDFEGKLKTMMAAGTPPDLFYLPPSLLPELASNQLIVPLDDRFNEQPKAWKTDFFPVLLDAFRYNPATQRIGPGGKLYGLPKDFTTSVFYVNTDLFHAAGIPVPYNGWTWDEFETDMKKITALSGTPTYAGRTIYGGSIEGGNDMIRNILWTFGGDFFGPGGYRDVALDSPADQKALNMIVRLRLKEKTVYNPTGIAKEGGQEFFNGNIGCDGPVGRWKVPRFSEITGFHWDVVPVPHETEKASMIYYTAWSMSSSTRHPDEAFRLMKYLCGRSGQVQQSRLGLAMPALQSVAYSPDFLSPSGLPNIHSQVFLDAIPHARLQQLPREPEWGRIFGDKITKSIQLGQATPMQSAHEIKAAWLAALDSPLRKHEWPAMKWNGVLALTAGILASIVAVMWWRAKREKLGPLDRAQQRAGWMFIMPWLIGFLILALGPMIASLLLGFTEWSGMVPLSQAKSVGWANYQQMMRDPAFLKSLQVTVYFVILAVPIGQIAALAVAMLMNLKVRGIEWFRTIYFVPSVVSGAALSVMWLQIFNKDYGILNKVLAPFTHLFHAMPPDWFGTDAKIWAVPAFVIMGLWGVGGGMIIYLAGLKGIPASLYEAATIDGAGPSRKFWNVTLPMLSPLIFYNLVMGLIGSFQVFTQAYIMTGAGPDNATLFYVLNLYRQAFEFHNMGYASALAWVLFLIVLALTLVVFRGSKKWVYYEGLKS